MLHNTCPNGNYIPIKSDQVSLIRRELLDITQNFGAAIVLNQFIYWTNKSYEWIYKSAPQLIKETMLPISPRTMHKYINILVDKDLLESRQNNFNKWDKTRQYKINIQKLKEYLSSQEDNKKINSDLSFYKDKNKKVVDLESYKKTRSKTVDRIKENEMIIPSEDEELRIEAQPVRIIIKTKIKDTKEDINIIEKPIYVDKKIINHSSDETKDKQAICIWNKYINDDESPNFFKRQLKISEILYEFFESDIEKWENFCKDISSTPFLMGQNDRKWKIKLNWILIQENLQKVLSGKYKSYSNYSKKGSDCMGKKQSKPFSNIVFLGEHTLKNTSKSYDEISQEEIESIKEPLWKYICENLREQKRYFPGMHKVKISNLKMILKGEDFITIKTNSAVQYNNIERNTHFILDIVKEKHQNVCTLKYK